MKTADLAATQDGSWRKIAVAIIDREYSLDTGRVRSISVFDQVSRGAMARQLRPCSAKRVLVPVAVPSILQPTSTAHASARREPP